MTHVRLPRASNDFPHKGSLCRHRGGKGALGVPEIVDAVGDLLRPALGDDSGHGGRRNHVGFERVRAIVLVAEHDRVETRLNESGDLLAARAGRGPKLHHSRCRAECLEGLAHAPSRSEASLRLGISP